MTKGQVLIVDDEADVIDYLSAILEENNYEVLSAQNAEEGYGLAVKNIPDVICLDIMMPHETGLSQYIRIRENDKLMHVPVIILSGMEKENEFNFSDYVSDKRIPPPDVYMEKPISVDDFITNIQRLISIKNTSIR
jgi:CheY-like chemotaxis protein